MSSQEQHLAREINKPSEDETHVADGAGAAPPAKKANKKAMNAKIDDGAEAAEPAKKEESPAGQLDRQTRRERPSRKVLAVTQAVKAVAKVVKAVRAVAKVVLVVRNGKTQC